MENKLTKEEVLHVAHLARIHVDDKEIEKYQVELGKLLEDIEKIKDVENYDEELLIAPHMHTTTLRSDCVGTMLSEEEIMKNVPHHNGNFVEVPVGGDVK